LRSYLSQHAGDATHVDFEPGSTISRIDPFTFNDCQHLSSICLPASIEVLGDQSFWAESPISRPFFEDITFERGSKLRSIEGSALARCPYLKSISIPETVQRIDVESLPYHGPFEVDIDSDNPFFKAENGFLTDFKQVTLLAYCGDEGKVQIPDKLETIGPSSFHWREGTTSIVFGAKSNLRSIGAFAFEWCWRLRSMTLPAALRVLGEFCFVECNGLKRVSFAPRSMLRELEEGVFVHCGKLEPVVFPPSVEKIGPHCFFQCPAHSRLILSAPSHLRELLSLPETVTEPTAIPDSVEVLSFTQDSLNRGGYTLIFGHDSKLAELRVHSELISRRPPRWDDPKIAVVKTFRSFLQLPARYLKRFRPRLEFSQ
jgi:hypothetical protein